MNQSMPLWCRSWPRWRCPCLCPTAAASSRPPTSPAAAWRLGAGRGSRAEAGAGVRTWDTASPEAGAGEQPPALLTSTCCAGGLAVVASRGAGTSRPSWGRHEAAAGHSHVSHGGPMTESHWSRGVVTAAALCSPSHSALD